MNQYWQSTVIKCWTKVIVYWFTYFTICSGSHMAYTKVTDWFLCSHLNEYSTHNSAACLSADWSQTLLITVTRKSFCAIVFMITCRPSSSSSICLLAFHVFYNHCHDCGYWPETLYDNLIWTKFLSDEGQKRKQKGAPLTLSRPPATIVEHALYLQIPAVLTQKTSRYRHYRCYTDLRSYCHLVNYLGTIQVTKQVHFHRRVHQWMQGAR
jgi:hypothetical protein